MINEAILYKDTIVGFIDTVSTINTLICKVYNVTNINDIKPDELDEKLKEFYDKNISNWINNIKKLNDELEKQNVKWCVADGKLSLDADLTDKKYKSIYRLLSIIAHPDQAQNLKNTCNTLVNTAQHIDTSDTDVFAKLFNGDELSEEETSKITEFLKNKFTKLSDDDIKEIISKISELANKTKDEKLTESLLLESAYSKLSKKDKEKLHKAEVEINNLINSIQKLIDNKDKDDNILNQILKRAPDLENDKIEEIENKYIDLLNSTKEKYLKLVNKRRDKKTEDKLGLYRINPDQYDTIVKGKFHDKLYRINKKYTDSFDSIFSITKDDVKDKVEAIKNDDTKSKYLQIVSDFGKNEINKLFNEFDEYLKTNTDEENPAENNTTRALCKRVWISTQALLINSINAGKVKDENQLKDALNKALNELKEYIDSTKNDIEKIKKSLDKAGTPTSEDDDNLLEIYKIIISLLKKDDSFKADVKNNEYELLGDVSIEESYKSLKQMFLLEKLEKSDFRTNLGKLKDYLLKLVQKDKGGELQKTDDKHEVVLMQPRDVIKSMGVTYEPEEKKSDNSNVITGELPGGKEIKQIPVIPNASDSDEKDDATKKEGKPEDKSDEQPAEKDETGHQPVLIFSNVYGMDIAYANANGPRKEMYSLKGSFHSLQFFEIKHGMNLHDIQEMLGEWMHTMVNNLCNITAVSPFEKKKNWWKDKFIPNKNLKENEERREFGNLTNGEIADIMNKKENASNYVRVKTNAIEIAETDEDKDYVKKHEDHYKNQLDNPDEETLKLVKDAYPDAIDKDGKINKDYKDKDGKTLPQIFAGYSLAQHKAKNTEKSSGFWNKLKNFVKDLFGGDKERGKKVNSALTYLNKGLNENLNEYDDFLEWCFKPLTLKEFIIEKNIKGTY